MVAHATVEAEPASAVELVVPQVLARLAVTDSFCACTASRAWRQASESLEAWTGVVLSAQHPTVTIGAWEAMRDASTVYPNSIVTMNDKLLQCLALKLRRVCENHSVSVVPPQSTEGASTSDRSPMQLRQISFGKAVYWWLCYNTKEFGWFDKERTNTFAIGLKVWAPCPMLCRWFAEAPALGGLPAGGCLKECSVLELGPGIGMLGVVLARLGASRVLVTDNNPTVLRVASINARVNSASNVEVARLAFGADAAAKFRAKDASLFDRIVGADIVYSKDVVRPVFETVSAFLKDGGTFSVGFVQRDKAFALEFEVVCEEFGFELVHSCFLAKALRDTHPPEVIPPGGHGMLADLRRFLDCIPNRGSCLGETDDKVQLFEYRRKQPLDDTQVCVYLDELD